MTTIADMSSTEFLQCGDALINWIAEYLKDPRCHSVLANRKPGDLERCLPVTAPVEGESMETILADFDRIVLPGVTHWNHPGFHGYFSISSSGPGILGELLTAALNVNAMLWKSCPAATELENVTLRWVLEWLRLPSTWFGMIVDSASTAVLQAIVAARQKAEPASREFGPSGKLVAYLSEHTHSSVEKAAVASGVGRANLRYVPADSEFRMRAGALSDLIRADLERGLKPFFAVATVGTTSSTAVDPVAELSAVCREHGLWLHVDGAYGGAFGMLAECEHLMKGVEWADSFVVNAHKLMMVPLDCSLFYTAHRELLRSAFSIDAEYLKTNVANVVDFMDHGLALGRRFRALKLWFVMRYFGKDGVAAILRKNLAMANWLGGRIAAAPRFCLVAPADLGLVCFRMRDGDEATLELIDRINRAGRNFVSHTLLEGHFTIRVAIGNIRTEWRDIEELWSEIDGT